MESCGDLCGEFMLFSVFLNDPKMEKNEVTILTNHTKLFRAVKARLIVRTEVGRYRSE